MKTYRALAALLTYPEGGLIDALPEIAQVLRTERLAPRLDLDEIFSGNLIDLQERYVALFDRSRALSLHLFEHVHGESRDRGQAMVDLVAVYEQHGMRLAANELPDYLPVFLEFLSTLEADEAKAMLADTAGILRALGERLRSRDSPYAELFVALLAIAGEPGLGKTKKVPPPAENLDRQWMDPEVSFGGPQPVRLYRNGVPA